jgi:hypothetical protein
MDKSPISHQSGVRDAGSRENYSIGKQGKNRSMKLRDTISHPATYLRAVRSMVLEECAVRQAELETG